MAAVAVPSYQRVETGSVNIPVADLQNLKAEQPTDFDKATEEWVNSFNKIIETGSFAGLKDLFVQDSYWRDHLCLSWDHVSLFTRTILDKC
jgi:hypothetical protein